MVRLGVDIGATSAHGVAIDEDRNILAESIVPSRKGEEGIVGVLLEVARHVAEKAGAQLADFASVGVGIPGVVNRMTGEVSSAVNLDLDQVKLAEIVSPHFSVRVRIDNDVKATVLGAASLLNINSVSYLNLGTGVSSATLGKAVVRGHANAAGEIGHFVLYPGGNPCRCGQYGCLETVIGGYHLSARMEALGLDWTILDQDTSGLAQGVREQVVRATARTVTLLALAYDPEKIVLGGGVVKAAPWFLGAVKADLIEQASQAAFPDYRSLAQRVVTLDVGQPVAALGAALVGAEYSV